MSSTSPPISPLERKLRTYASHVPNLVLSHVARRERERERGEDGTPSVAAAASELASVPAKSETFPAAVLFLDIVGYVKLTSATHRGTELREARDAALDGTLTRSMTWRSESHARARGVVDSTQLAGLTGETMRDVVNACFENALATIRARGGDVLKFAGDALYATWPAPRGENGPRGASSAPPRGAPRSARSVTPSPLGVATLRAIECALEILTDANERLPFNPSIPDARLKACVGAGELASAHVGGGGDGTRWEFLVAGEPLRQIERVASLARPGQVVIAEEVLSVDGVKERLTCSSMAATTPPTAVAAAPAVAAAAAAAAAGAAESEECRRSSFDEGPPFAVLARATSFTYSLSTGSKFGDSTALDDGALAPIAHVVDGVRRSRYEEDEEENDFENVKEATSTSAPAGSSRDALAEALEGSSASSREAIAAALARYIPRSAHATDPRSVNMRWLGEIRQCSVLFMNFTAAAADKDESESESESESVVTFANKALRVAQDVLHKHSGCVRQCIVDDKGGITLVACFGLPASTHEDDPWRAVATAMTTKSETAAKGVQTRTGVATGEAFCGYVGTRQRCEYALYGDVVNTAARFMSNTANDGILVCETTRARCATRVAFGPERRLTLKGKEGVLIPAFAPLRMHTRRSSLRPSSTIASGGGDGCGGDRNGRSMSVSTLPPTAAGYLRARISALPPRTQLIAKHAAVIGRAFDLTALAAVSRDCGHLDVTVDAARRAAKELVDVGVFAFVDLRRGDDDEAPAFGGGGGGVAFTSDVVQSVVYGLLPYAARQPVHVAIARRLEAAHGGAGDDDRNGRSMDVTIPTVPLDAASSLAYHWTRGGRSGRAIEYLARAGEVATRVGDVADAATFYERALELARGGGGGGGGEKRLTTSLRRLARARGGNDAAAAAAPRERRETNETTTTTTKAPAAASAPSAKDALASRDDDDADDGTNAGGCFAALRRRRARSERRRPARRARFSSSKIKPSARVVRVDG